MLERENARLEWLHQVMKGKEFSLTALAGDASFRRYFRLQSSEFTGIVMDAPPDKEKIEPFLHVAKLLSQAKVQTPDILAQEERQGFLLLSDFGDQLLLQTLQQKQSEANTYYQEAIRTLLAIQTCSIQDPKLPSFDKAFMQKEMELCPLWFFTAYLDLKLTKAEINLIQQTLAWIATQLGAQPLTFIHRDYHSRNLMVLPKNQGYTLGVLDFQDAMRGPWTYDLVSLLKDCYIAWPRTQVLEWVSFFHSHHPFMHSCSLPELIRAFDLCGLQRHLKVLGIFCRLYLRDNKKEYLAHLPLVLQYVLECCETYEELHSFFYFFQQRVVLPCL